LIKCPGVNTRLNCFGRADYTTMFLDNTDCPVPCGDFILETFHGK